MMAPGFRGPRAGVEKTMQGGPERSASKLAFSALTAASPAIGAKDRGATPASYDQATIGAAAPSRGIILGALLGLIVWFALGAVVFLAL